VGEPPLVIVIVMGVAGAGKTTIGERLAAALGYQFRDADEFHPPANVEKMRSGRRLDDADRDPWLQAMADAIDCWLREGTGVVLACSALKERYRTRLVRDPERVRVVYLKVTTQVARQRVAQRSDHFMPADLVDSQFETLEEPRHAVVVDASQPPDAIVRQLGDALQPGA
jgi:gluconokinase